MNLDLQLIFDRTEEDTLDEFKAKAVSAEKHTNAIAGHHASPSAETSLLPGAAYPPPENHKGKNQPAIGAIRSSISQDPPDWFTTWLSWQQKN